MKTVSSAVGLVVAGVVLGALAAKAGPVDPNSSGTAPGGVEKELTRLLLADAHALATRAPAPAKPASDKPAGVFRVASTAEPVPPPKAAVETPREDPVDKFFRTGVLTGERGPEVTRMLTVGSCGGGELLNLKLLQ